MTTARERFLTTLGLLAVVAGVVVLNLAIVALVVSLAHGGPSTPSPGGGGNPPPGP